MHACIQLDPLLRSNNKMAAKVMPNIAKISIARQRNTSIAAIGGFELGPLHTRAETCDHEIVRSQRKSVPTHLQNHVVWSWTFRCTVKSYVTGDPQPNAISMNFYSCVSSHMIK